jgi:hypothetical protein
MMGGGRSPSPSSFDNGRRPLEAALSVCSSDAAEQRTPRGAHPQLPEARDHLVEGHLLRVVGVQDLPKRQDKGDSERQ